VQILLLDEATSALDAASEAIVTQALNELAAGSKHKLSAPTATSTPSGTQPAPSGIAPLRDSFGNRMQAYSLQTAAAACDVAAPTGRTTIIVAHRLATVTAADTIAVMSTGGKLLEMGSPAQLLGSGGKGHYAQMVMQQSYATPLAAAAAVLQQ
jgi:ABC-type multidrug transport system fused ATPase/permease subunit